MRAAFTRNLSLLNMELAKERPIEQELQVRLAIVRDKASEIEDINRKIFEVMVDDDKVNEETLVQETETSTNIE